MFIEPWYYNRECFYTKLSEEKRKIINCGKKQEKRLNNRGMLSGAMPFIICVKLADHTLPFLCKSIFFLSCSLLCRIFPLPVFSFNCSHAQKAQPISLRVHLINMVQREEKQERVLKGETSASTKNTRLLSILSLLG